MSTRKPAVAGIFYPAEKEILESDIKEFLKNAPAGKFSGVKALIVPHAGYIYSGQVAACAYALLSGCRKELQIIIIGPSHYASLDSPAADVNEYWETPLGKVGVIKSQFSQNGKAHLAEHCIEVQIPFLQEVLAKFFILPLVVGNGDPVAISRRIEPLLNENTLLIVSSDLSHYNSYKKAVNVDGNTNAAIAALDYEKMLREGDACGKIPILAVMDLAKRLGWKCKMLNYMNSGDTAGQKEEVVGYGSFVFY
jgi:hypothetical protein